MNDSFRYNKFIEMILLFYKRCFLPSNIRFFKIPNFVISGSKPARTVLFPSIKEHFKPNFDGNSLKAK